MHDLNTLRRLFTFIAKVSVFWLFILSFKFFLVDQLYIRRQQKQALVWNGVINDENGQLFEKEFGESSENIRNNLVKYKKQIVSEVDDLNNIGAGEYRNQIRYSSNRATENPYCKINKNLGNPEDITLKSTSLKIPQFNLDERVNLSLGLLREYDKDYIRNKNVNVTNQEQENDCNLFSSFIKLAINNLENVYSNNSINNIEQEIDYPKQIISLFDQDNFEKSPIRGYWFYLANNRNAMITYPYRDKNTSISGYWFRPWGLSAEGDYPTYLPQSSSDFGITSPYIDNIENNVGINQANIIRTAWYKFNYLETDYLLCLDLYFDNTNFQNTRATFEIPIIKKRIPFSEWFLLGSLLSAWTIALLYNYLINNKYIKSIVIRTLDINTDDYLQIQLVRTAEMYFDIETKVETKEYTRNNKKVNFEQINLEGLKLPKKWSLRLEQYRKNEESFQEDTVSEIIRSKQYDFDKVPPEIKKIEIWKARLISDVNPQKNKDLADFIASWSNRHPNLENNLELNIYVLKNCDPKYRQYEDLIKEQIFRHLLISDEREFIGILESDVHTIINPNIPQELSDINIDELNSIVKNNNRLQGRRIIFKDINTLQSLYHLNKVKAIWRIDWIQKFSQEQLLDFFDSNCSDNRYFLEGAKDEFIRFYDNLNSNIKTRFKDEARFRIIPYQEGVVNFVKPEDNFFIVEIDKNFSFVVYANDKYYDDSSNYAGWISWRKVDVEFYSKLWELQTQKDSGNNYPDSNTYLNSRGSV